MSCKRNRPLRQAVFSKTGRWRNKEEMILGVLDDGNDGDDDGDDNGG